MTRLIGIDHGSRRIGLAVGDTETGIAFGRAAVLRTNERDDLVAIATLAGDEAVDRFVIGLPLLEDGREGAQAGAARRFAARLAQQSALPVDLVDERYSSWQARTDLITAGRRARRASGELDSAAARVILQQYLDDLADRGRAGADPPPTPEEPA